jgi:hypothetical protein
MQKRLRTNLNYLQCMAEKTSETEFLLSQLEGSYCYIKSIKRDD